MTRCSRRGFAVVDVAVTLVMLALLVSLALPAMQKARQTAAKVQCESNLQAIGRGVQSFAAANNQMLPYNQLTAPIGSWNTQLLPFLGEEKLAREYNPGHDWWAAANSPNRAVAATRVGFFQCPAVPRPERFVLTNDPETDGQSFQAAPTDYVGSAAAYYQDNQPKNLYPGAMHHRTLVKRLRTPDIVDGTSQTLLIVEMADKPNSWQAGKLIEDRSDKPQSTSISGQWAAPNWNHLRSFSTDGKTPFGPCAVNCSNSASIYGFHPGGANVLFVDGSVRFVKAGMSQEILIALVSYSGGEVLSPDDY
jgi:prepilin-type processing-associated H-X9-DG protein